MDYAALTKSARIWAHRYGAGEDTEDIAQEALLKLWRAAERGATWDADALLYRYLHQCVRTTMIDAVRAAQARRRPVVVGPPDARLVGGNTEADALTRLELGAVLEALAQMGRRGRTTLLVMAGLSAREAAPLVGISPRSASQDLYLAREALRQEGYQL